AVPAGGGRRPREIRLEDRVVCCADLAVGRPGAAKTWRSSAGCRCRAAAVSHRSEGNRMHTPLCDRLGIELPIFAFTHCRDVVAAVCRAGGFGVLGAVGFPPEQLEIELRWIDEHIGDRPYGVDIVIPGKYEGMGEIDPKKLEEQLRAAIPARHREFAEEILSSHGVPKLP